jgi:prolyl-tRNA synthetase
VANNTVELFRRDTGTKESINGDEIATNCSTILHDMQKNLFEKTKTMRETNTVKVETYDEFKKALEDGKFVLAHRDGTPETEELIKQETKATIRCIPEDAIEEDGKCVKTGNKSGKRVLFAIAY